MNTRRLYCGDIFHQWRLGQLLLYMYFFFSVYFITAVGGFAATVLNFEVGRFQMQTWDNHDPLVALCLNGGDLIAFFIQQVRCHADWYNRADFPGARLIGFFLNQTQDGERQGFDIPDGALAIATRAYRGTRFT